MTEHKVKVVLTDIEGTTTSISFVKDVLFPYAKLHTKEFLQETWNEPSTQSIVQDLLKLSAHKEYRLHAGVVQTDATAAGITNFVCYLIDKDLKLGPLKTLQGLVWEKGYNNGSLKAHVYDDVPAAFRRWQDASIRIAIYSSGSVRAQQLLFGQTIGGNLLPHISAHFDTAIGNKQQAQSYGNIARELSTDIGDILFLTDIVKEAEAAREAGMQVVLLNRPGNAPLTDDDKTDFTVLDDFDALKLVAL